MSEALALIDQLDSEMNATATAAQERIQNLLDDESHTTDLGNAVRLINRHGKHIRYSSEMGKWFIWDGRRWEADKTQRIRTMAFDTVREIYREASQAPSESRRGELATWAVQSESATRISSMVSLAQALVPITVDALDASPLAFNVNNGVLNLKTGELLPHNPSFLLTKLAPIDYNPNAMCPTWMAFLERIMGGKQELIEFLQRAVGYSMTGLTNEHVLFFLYGTGANGKSTFLNTMMSVLGDYAKPTDPDLLLSKQGDSHPTSVADLMGVRMGITNEIEEGKRLAENLVKQLTGGDVLKARYMRQDFFSFTPSHKLWIAGNHKPVIRGQDEGIWRRIRLIPFNVTIPPEHRDKHLEAKLRREAPGILRWAFEGAMKWRDDGLTFPDEVKAAVDQYRNEQDVLSGFFEEECIVNINARVPKGVLYRTYVDWCDENGQKAYSQRRLSQAIQERFSVREEKSGNTRFWSGIGLLSEA